jgi:hypothetical protein
VNAFAASREEKCVAIEQGHGCDEGKLVQGEVGIPSSDERISSTFFERRSRDEGSVSDQEAFEQLLVDKSYQSYL